ncbi:LexA family transcriptional regulator [Rufibacter sp. XAAS-G3-1]|uniref:LexA family protein n=1 Tax=Rufibacter sp. XAAS-G3-1 TaxID=2729134 RepID=UPI0015E6663B|nr:translesion error-prone DNA polymerase V autoproteolytic subunit [Rufibacter sp. XAAS-G3-1]
MEAAIIPLHPIEEQRFLIIIDQGNSLPLFTTTVQAGFPSPATDYSAEPIDLNTYSSAHPASTFLVEVVGESMVKAGIMPKDLAIVNRDLKPKDGNIVLAFVDGGFTIKRLRLEKDATYLVAETESDSFPPIRVDSPEDGMFWGVVVGIHRKY